MKLENETFDVRKYRDIFEKEVSRKHSVKSIDIREEEPDVKVVDILLEDTETKNSQLKITTDENSPQICQQQHPSLITKGRSELEHRLRQTV